MTKLKQRRVHTEKMDAIWIEMSQEQRKEARQRVAAMWARFAAFKQKVKEKKDQQ